MKLLFAGLIAALLAACATPVPLPPVALTLFGEEHDQPHQQAQVAATVAELAARGELAAVVIEMAERGKDTRALGADATPAQVRAALGWERWAWSSYEAVVMNAVRAGVPVWGGNLPRGEIRSAMADAALENRIPAAAREHLLAAVRAGHCGMLPTGQEAPMLRVQIARDAAMAATVQERLAEGGPGRRVILLAGAQHVSRDRGVPLHLAPDAPAHVVIFGSPEPGGLVADAWRFSAVRERPDPCAELRRRGLQPRSPA